ncbi:MAG: hypothetical protein FJ290_25165 [Planctomycetes bacterium]|nr:hypothetical protein [Planctomycetota bacterium]
MTPLYWLLGLDSPGSVARAVEWLVYPARPTSIALLVLLGLVAAAVAALNFLPHNVMRWRTRLTLAAVRLAGFALLALMLVQLELRLTVERSLRPAVAVLTDVSGSMGIRDAGGHTRFEAARSFAEERLTALGRKARLLPYAFHWQLCPDDATAAPAATTRLVSALEELSRREDELQAAILLTDGADTAGDRGELAAPLLASRGLPVYPVVFGSTDAPRVARVRVTGGSAYVRLGDELRLNATLSATELGEQTARVLLFEDDAKQPLQVRENVRLGRNPVDVSFVVKPTRVGTRLYRIALEGVSGAASERLLAAEHSVLVVNAPIRVLVVDIARDERKFLAHWLARDPVVELASLTLLPQGGWYAQGALQHKDVAEGLPDAEADLFRYDVIILGDIPRSYFRAGTVARPSGADHRVGDAGYSEGDTAETRMQRLVEFVGRRGGGLVTLGGYAAYAAGQYQDSALAGILPFVVEPTDKPQVPKPFKAVPTAIGLGHPLMQLAFEPEANRDAWFELPTLDGCNRVERLKPGASLLAVREMPAPDSSEDAARGTRHATLPVMAIQNVGKGKVLSLAMDTTWRWEMKRPLEGDDYYRRFWGNVVRHLAPDPRIGPNSPQILAYQSQTPVGQTITLATRLVDPVYQPIREANLAVKVTRPSGRVSHIYPRDGRNAPGLYEYDIALDEPGRWKVEATHDGKTATEEFVAGESDDELDDPRARPQAMAELAKATGGQSFTPAEAATRLAELPITPRRVTQTSTIALWNLPVTMVLLIALVALDCFIRKRRGMV